MNDNKIIDLYWQRSESAILETDKKYGRYCHTIAYNILYNDEDAEECVNDTYMRTWKSIPPQRPECLSAFLGKITRNLSIDRYRKSERKKRSGIQVELVLSELEDCIYSKNGIEEMMKEKFLVQCINQFLYRLPEKKRNIFIRRYWYLYPIAQIAKQYSMSENKVTLMLFRMRKDLKFYLEEEGITL